MITLDIVEENGLEVDKGEMGDRLVVGGRSPGRRFYGLPDDGRGDLGRERTSENRSQSQGLLPSPGYQTFVMAKITGSTKCHLLSLGTELSILHAAHTLLLLLSTTIPLLQISTSSLREVK